MDSDEKTHMAANGCEQHCLNISKYRKHVPTFIGRWVTRVLVGFVLWATVWSIVGQDALPGGNIYGLSILLAVAALVGFLVRLIPWLKLPSLLGMLIAGFVLKNVDGIDVAKEIDNEWSLTIRNVALVVILLRSGLGLDQNALKRAKWTIGRLALLPCIAEAITVAVMGHLLLDMGFLWSFQLGFLIAAVSPAVVVPTLLELQEKGYGVDEGIPTLGVASASLENVFAISLVGVFLGLAFSEGNLTYNIFRGPIEIVLGLAIGIIVGPLLWILPFNHKSDAPQKNRFVLLSSLGLLSLFGLKRANFSGAGALGCLVLSFVAGQGWSDSDKKQIGEAMSVVWDLFMPLLFALIGAEVNVEYMESRLIGRGIAILVIGMIPRLLMVYLVVSRNNFTRKEKLFLTLSWIPKATVQAAIGSITLDAARDKGFIGEYQERHGVEILTLSVLSILITAPIGAIAMTVTGPKLLQKSKFACDDNPDEAGQSEKVELNNDIGYV
ncbi:sodium/hydrogen exchanger 9B2-like [Dendronephthya gigantea]|uniref:sodium/hydrogen exchanger 9B2-like n=1 Tax=Dendronephthya gigantea TaxID=151771 RepID=UPI00106978E4|nr:sodium/hydrogen exchanger 9B2-like [Dendronephthya gigantea]XP_028408355.1 sodium/hydrogen exchanger 9B2-like [Dendronephthya gigantea]